MKLQPLRRKKLRQRLPWRVRQFLGVPKGHRFCLSNLRRSPPPKRRRNFGDNSSAQLTTGCVPEMAGPRRDVPTNDRFSDFNFHQESKMPSQAGQGPAKAQNLRAFHPRVLNFARLAFPLHPHNKPALVTCFASLLQYLSAFGQ